MAMCSSCDKPNTTLMVWARLHPTLLASGPSITPQYQEFLSTLKTQAPSDDEEEDDDDEDDDGEDERWVQQAARQGPACARCSHVARITCKVFSCPCSSTRIQSLNDWPQALSLKETQPTHTRPLTGTLRTPRRATLLSSPPARICSRRRQAFRCSGKAQEMGVKRPRSPTPRGRFADTRCAAVG